MEGQFRALIDVDQRTVTETQQRARAGSRANDLIFADGRAGFQNALRNQVQLSRDGRHYCARPARSEPAIQGVTSGVENTRKERGRVGPRSPSRPP